MPEDVLPILVAAFFAGALCGLFANVVGRG
jgi:ascorbate-specific PTS system EIIC-type component UlaA